MDAVSANARAYRCRNLPMILIRVKQQKYFLRPKWGHFYNLYYSTAKQLMENQTTLGTAFVKGVIFLKYSLILGN